MGCCTSSVVLVPAPIPTDVEGVAAWGRLGVGNVLRAYTVLYSGGKTKQESILESKGTLRMTAKLQLRNLHTLQPELPVSRVSRLVSLFKRINKSGSGHINEWEMEQWLSKKGEKESISQSVFFKMLFRVVDPVVPRTLRCDEFVVLVDRLCTMDMSQLTRFAFFCLSAVGTAPGLVPHIAVSSLTRRDIDFREAAADRTHPSRTLLVELRKKARMNKKEMTARARMEKELAYTDALSRFTSRAQEEQAAIEAAKADAGEDFDDEEEEDDEEEDGEWGDAVDRARAIAAAQHDAGQYVSSYVTGPEDLLSWHDFLELARATPISFFDLEYLQLFLRRNTFGERFWKRRARDVALWSEHHGGLSKGSSTCGYGIHRFKQGATDPFSLIQLPRDLRIGPPSIPAAVRYALADTKTTPEGGGAPVVEVAAALPPVESHLRQDVSQRHVMVQASTGASTSSLATGPVPSPAAPVLPAASAPEHVRPSSSQALSRSRSDTAERPPSRAPSASPSRPPSRPASASHTAAQEGVMQHAHTQHPEHQASEHHQHQHQHHHHQHLPAQSHPEHEGVRRMSKPDIEAARRLSSRGL